MASQEEDNKLECISNVNKEQERYYLNVYKKYDSVLNDKSEKFEKKVQSLIDVWKSIAELNLSQFDIRYVIQIIDWAKLHALNIVLTGEWRSTKESFRNSLLENIEEAQSNLSTVNDAFSSRCQKLADVVKKPWEDPVLANLIQEKDVDIGPKEIEFFCVETAYLVSVRLKKLCENHCEDLALNLVTNFLNYKKLATIQNFNLNATETQLWFIFDIYVALLYKFQDKAKIIHQFEELQLEEGVGLIKRFAKKRVQISKIWRNCNKIAIFGSRFFLSKALMKYNDDLRDFLVELLKIYLNLSNTDILLQEFVVSVRNITNLADAAGLCVMCEIIHREAADKLRHFAIEMYIRALTTDMNELERLKHVNEEEKVKLTTSRLANTFTNLADLLDDHVKVARECVLTAFSLKPTKDRLKRIEDLAKRSGFPVLDTGQEWKCRLHPPALPTDDIAWVCSECGEWMCKPELTAPLQMNMALHEALQESVLGISEALCDDLVVCLSNPRYQILSWLLSWGDLYRLCIMYLNDPEKTKNFVTELKFVDVDYSMFEHIKREPVDEYTGIEKGYEQYLDLDFVSDEETSSVSEDSMSHDKYVGLGSDGTGESYLPLPQPRSDPNTLKSLRMFRPNLKRKKEESDNTNLEKRASLESNNMPASSSFSTIGGYFAGSQNVIPPSSTFNLSANRMYVGSSNFGKSPMPPLQSSAATNYNIALNHGALVGNLNSYEYSARAYEIAKQPIRQNNLNIDEVNSRLQSSFSNSVNLRCYPPKHSNPTKTRTAPIPSSTIVHPDNFIFGNNLSSGTSTTYVSNIIKSNLTYGVPKVSLNMSSYTVTLPTTTVSNSHNFGSVETKKQSSYAGQTAITPKNAVKQLSSNTVQDLDALLKEVVNDIDSDSNKFDSESKNGIAATLLQLGGQVANNQKQLIQVLQQQFLIPQMKLPQETFLPNGTTEDCKMRLKNKLNKTKIHGEALDQTVDALYKSPKLIEVNNCQDKAKQDGKPLLKMSVLRVEIPRLNLEKYHKQNMDNKTGNISDKMTELTLPKPKVPLSIPERNINPDLVLVKCMQENTALLKIPLAEHCQPPDIVTVGPEQMQYKTHLFLEQEHSIHPQDRLLLQTEVPTVQIPLQPKMLSPISISQKEQLFIQQEPQQVDFLPLMETVKTQVPWTQSRKTMKDPMEILQRLDSVIIIPPIKAKEVIYQAILNKYKNQNLLKETILELVKASMNLVKNQELPTILSSNNILASCGNSLLQKEHSTANIQLNPKKVETIYIPVVSQKTITPIITDCDKDKNHIMVQIDENQKTDGVMTDAMQNVTSLIQGNGDSASKISIEKTDYGLATDETQLQLISKELKLPNAQNNNNECLPLSEVCNEMENILKIIKNVKEDSREKKSDSNKDNVMILIDLMKEILQRRLKDEVLQIKVRNVNSIVHCDNINKTHLATDDSNYNVKLDNDANNKENFYRIEKWLDNAAKWNNIKEQISVDCINDPNFIGEIVVGNEIREDIYKSLENSNQDNNDSKISNDCIEERKHSGNNYKIIEKKRRENQERNRNFHDTSTDLTNEVFKKLEILKVKEGLRKEKRYHRSTISHLERKRKKMGTRNFFNYISLWHDYSKSQEASQFSRPRSPKYSLNLTYPKSLKTCIGFSENRTFLLFNEDIDKENIKMACGENTTDASAGSSEEMDSDEGVSFNTRTTNFPGLVANSNSFYEEPIIGYFKTESKIEGTRTKNIKKYSNTHKLRHLNVPCFKVDQENNRKSNRDKIKNVSEKLKKSPSKTTNSLSTGNKKHGCIMHHQKLKFKLNEINKCSTSIPHKERREKRCSPLLDFNSRNFCKAKLIKKHNLDINKYSDLIRLKTILRKKFDYALNNSLIKNKVRSNIDKKNVPRKANKFARFALQGVPGLNDFLEVRPNNTEQVVNVVQVSGSRSSTVTNQNIQTSTQVTPHIQRIGQPKLSDQKPESTDGESIQSVSNSSPPTTQAAKPTTSQSSTLINILSSQMKPGQKTTPTTRQTPYINILSQQIIKQPNQPTVRKSLPKISSESRPQATTVIKVEPEETADAPTAKPLNSNVKIVATATQAGGNIATPTSTQGGTILQFICKSSSLPKFQQAFGKTVYQSSTSNDGTTETTAAPVAETSGQSQSASSIETKKVATKTVPVNVQPIAGNVIFRGQVPVGQTVSLIPPGSNTRQLFRITGSTHEQISLVKETVIQNKMSALLAAALQGKPKITEQNGELVEEYSATRITLCRPGTVPNTTRIVKPVQLQIPANVIRTPQTNMSSTTLEQLREFDMVYKQVKERSSNPAQPETTVQNNQDSAQQQRISFTYVNQVQKYTQLSPVVVVSSYNTLQQTGSPALNVTSQSNSGVCLTQANTITVPKVAVKSSKGKNIKSSATKTAPSAVPTIPKPQQKPQEDEHTTQRIFDILAEYAEQLRNSPDLNNKPAPRRRSNPPTNPSSSSSGSNSSKKKKKKNNSSPSNLVEADNEDLTMGSEDSSSGNIVQLSMTDEEQSQSASITPPETNLEPATSNTPTRPLIVTDTSNQPRNVIITDSSVSEALKMPNTTLIMPGSYIMPVSVVKGSQQIAVVSGGSKILTTVPARSGQNMLLFQSFVNQNKKGGISTVKYSTIQPFSGISSQNVAGVSAQPPVVLPSSSVATVALGQPMTLKKIEDERTNNAELLLTISQPNETIKLDKSPDIPQPDSSTSLSNDGIDTKLEEGNQSDSTSNDNIFNNIQKTNSVATSVIASVVKKEEGRSSSNVSEIDVSNIKVNEQNKQGERIESVLVNASTSNGPMLSHTNPRYRKPDGVESTTQTVKEFNHHGGKVSVSGTKIFKNNAIYYAIRTKKPTSKKIDNDLQKQTVMERELRLQKTLSEECEDLGVDEPSTSDLFPEADLLFDSNHSPSYDQPNQKIQLAEIKAKASMNLFSDDENSGPMRNDFFDYVEYHSVETDVDKINGNNISNESASSCDDSTLLPNCGTMSEVTLNSPISPEYNDSTHPINKYKYKYTNRKRSEKNFKPQSETWSEVTSSEDTLEVTKEDDTPIAIQEETVIDESIMEVEAVTENRKELAKCPIHGSTDRSSRRNSKRSCSCFNGSKSPNSSNIKKRMNTIKSQTPLPNKKALITKKR